MGFLEMLKVQSSQTRTLNGAKAWSTTGNACLDLFAVGGGMRYRQASDLISLFERAYIEEPETAIKLLFYIRDIRGGMGERRIFRILLRRAAKMWPKSAEKNVRYISEYGRFDDLFCLLGTPAEGEVIRFVKAQLDKDLAALEQRKDGDIRAHISLLAKWMPSVNTTSQKTCRTARRLAKALGMNERSYRKTLSALRANICVTERYLTEKRPQKIQYDAVPAGAMLKYRGAFERCDQERFGDFMEAVKNGEKTINAEPLFPYEILRPFTKLNPDMTAEAIEPAGSKVLEALWSYLPAGSLAENSICMIDTSGSMTCGREGSIKPIQIAVSLGLYHAERCKGAFHNHFITFQTRPHLIEIKGNTLKEKIHYIFSAPWSGWTNLEGAFDLLLNTACQSGASQDELPSTLYIISDMEFNGVMRSDETIFDNAKRKFEACGYKLPAVVMINVNSWQMQTPAGAHQKGVALMSGASVSAVGQSCSFNTTPLSQMYKILMSDRYKVIHA